MSALQELFGSRVKALRQEQGLSQVDLAERAHLSEEWVRRIERGAAAPSFQAIETIAMALRVSVGELFAEKAPAKADERIAAAIQDLDEEAVRWLITGARLLRGKSQT
jgi:transcriptional regulator with XRE-family HTH domain